MSKKKMINYKKTVKTQRKSEKTVKIIETNK